MTTVDFRTRLDGDVDLLDPTEFLEDRIPALLSRPAVGRPASPRPGSSSRRSPSTSRGYQLTLVPDGRWPRSATGPRRRTGGRPRSPSFLRTDAGHVVDLRPADDRTRQGSSGHGRFIRRVGTPSALSCSTAVRSTNPASSNSMTVTVHRSTCSRAFAPEDPPGEIGHFLAEAGFLHLEGVFTEEEMSAVSAELDDAMASAAARRRRVVVGLHGGRGVVPLADPRFQPEIRSAASAPALPEVHGARNLHRRSLRAA